MSRKDELKRYFKSKLLRDLGVDIIASLFIGLGVYTFAIGGDFVPGGISGIAIIIYHFTNFPIGVCILIMNIPIIIFCYRVMGHGFLLRSLKTMAISSFFIDVVFPMIPVYSGNTLIAAIFMGLSNGLGYAMIYNCGSSTGGSDFFILSIHKKLKHISIGRVSIVFDGIVMILGGFLFKRVDAFLYGMLATIIGTLVLDRVMMNAVSGKMVTIITSYGKDIANSINENSRRGATMLEGVGTYTGKPKQVVLCACSRIEVSQIKKITYQVDPEAILTISSYDEAFGEGFQNPKT